MGGKRTTESKERALALLRELVSCPSVTPRSAGSMELVEAELSKAGFILERMDAFGVSNLWATHGEGAPTLLFAGHLDVVPPGDAEAWSADPFTPTEKDGRIYGRGTTDMKGGVATMVVAATERAVRDPSHVGTIAIALTTDEEGPATHGILHVVEELAKRDARCEYALVCEPSSDKVFGDTVRVGRRGSLTGRIWVEGVQGHVAYPGRNVNPIPALTRICAKVSEMEFEPRGDGEEATTVQVVSVAADGGADNVVPGQASATVNFRYNPLDDPPSLRKRVEDICASEDIKTSCNWSDASKPYHTDRDGRMVKAICEACTEKTGIEPRLSVGGGTSDGRFLASICDEVVEFGTTGLTMHMVDEHVEISEIEGLVDIYSSCLDRLL